MKNFFSIVLMLVLLASVSISAAPTFQEKSVRISKITAVAGQYSNIYLGPFDISGCYDPVDLVLSTAELDSIIANPIWWASVTYKSGDTMKYHVRGIATLYESPPSVYGFDWSDSIGTNAKTCVLLGDTVEDLTKRNAWVYDQGAVGGDYMLPYLWIEVDPDTLALDTVVSDIVIKAKVLCPGAVR